MCNFCNKNDRYSLSHKIENEPPQYITLKNYFNNNLQFEIVLSLYNWQSNTNIIYQCSFCSQLWKVEYQREILSNEEYSILSKISSKINL